MGTIAVVGLSPRPERPSHQVARYLKSNGYRIIPVNPGHAEILGEPCYGNLKLIPDPVDVVDIFRRPEYVGPVVEDAIAMGAQAIWLQDGVVNRSAARLAEKAGLWVVMDDCMSRQHRLLFP
ncbi:MAG: CoA-binding protein [Fidelibacterota bacterium]